MLRSELPFAIDTGPGRVAAVALGEPFLGLLAIVALGLTLFPMLFAVYAGRRFGHRSQPVGDHRLVQRRARRRVRVRRRQAAVSRQSLALARPRHGSAWRSRRCCRVRRPRCARRRSCGSRGSAGSSRTACAPAVFRPAGGAWRLAATKLHGPAQVRRLRRAAAARAASAAGLDDLWRWLAAPDEQWFHVGVSAPEDLRRIGAAAGLPAGFSSSISRHELSALGARRVSDGPIPLAAGGRRHRPPRSVRDTARADRARAAVVVAARAAQRDRRRGHAGRGRRAAIHGAHDRARARARRARLPTPGRPLRGPAARARGRAGAREPARTFSS